MDAKRWSPLWVFVGGCLTGAALTGLRSLDGAESASNSRRDDGWSDVEPLSSKAGSVEKRVDADRAAPEVEARWRGATPAPQSASEATDQTADSQIDAANPDKVGAGHSVAEVLARLETEYRQRSAPGHAQAAALPVSESAVPARPNEQPRQLAQAQEQSAVSAAGGPKLPQSELPAIPRAAAPTPEAPASDARFATLSADDEQTSPAAEEATRLAFIRDEQAKALSSGQQQVAVQMQQLALLQQATLSEQFALLQLQLISLPLASRATIPTRSQRRAQGGRIVPSLPSSISATDNPWGFKLPPSVLVR